VGKLGYYFEADLNTYWLRARVYDPQRGRFISRDPVTEEANLYRWPGNSPVMEVDPSGTGLRDWLALVFAKNTTRVQCTKLSGSLERGITIGKDPDWACEVRVPEGPEWDARDPSCQCPEECRVTVSKEAVAGPRKGEIVYEKRRKGRCVWTGVPAIRPFTPSRCERSRPSFGDCRTCRSPVDCISCCSRAAKAHGWGDLAKLRCAEMCEGKWWGEHPPDTRGGPQAIQPPGGWRQMRGPEVHRTPRR